MLHETVIFTKEDGSTFMANVDKMDGPEWTVRFKDDTTKVIALGDYKKFELADEDNHHEFTMAFLYQRKENTLIELASDVLAKFDEIINYCPEDRDTLMEQLGINIRALRQAEKDLD